MAVNDGAGRVRTPTGALDPSHRDRGQRTPAALLADLRRAFSAAELAIAVSVAPPEYLLAVVCGLDVAHARDECIVLANYSGGRYYREYVLGRPSAFERLRYPPHGDRDEWIRSGPDTATSCRCSRRSPGRDGVAA